LKKPGPGNNIYLSNNLALILGQHHSMNFTNRRSAIKNLMFGILGTLSAKFTVSCKVSPHDSGLAWLTEDARRLIAEIADTILPDTDTPGAKAVGADHLIVRLLQDCYSRKDRDSIMKGIAGIERECIANFGRSFLNCSAGQRLAIIQNKDRESMGFWSKIRIRLFHQNHFFTLFKRLVLISYFTSQPGATRALSYESIPGRWIGCFEMPSGMKTWATE
jgi:hypothetical protein